ncbi:MAG: response regulator [Pseudomonadales bacterium]|nr:response regulator [Pseudomonadales bacterium]
MIDRFLTIFAPPINSEFFRDRLQTNLRAMLLILIAAAALAFLFNSSVDSRVISAGLFVYLVFVLLFFSQGDMLFARLTTPFVGYIAISLLLLTGAGLHSSATPALLVVIVYARALGSGTSSIVYLVLSFIALAAAYEMEMRGMITPSAGPPSQLVDLLNLYTVLMAVSASVWFLTKNIEDDRDLAWESTQGLRENELALGEKETQYRLLADNAQDFIWTADLDFNYTYCSPSCERITGFTPAELVGKSIFENLVDEKVVENYLEIFSREMKIETESPRSGNSLAAEVEFRRKDGSDSWLEAQISFLRDDSGKVIGIVGTTRDISDRILAETRAKEIADQLRQAQKIDSIGQLAGGIAHDFNNMLVAIQGYSDLAANHESTPDEVKRYVSEIRKAALRAENLTRQLLTFSRRQAMERKPVSLNTLLTDLQSMLSRLIPANVTVDLDLGPRVHEILGDSGQLEQLVVNLCVNARDAMPAGGTLTIRTANAVIDDAEAERHANARAGDYARLSVADTGIGMESELQKRIFEPFFTTKREGHGTGLGLSVVHGIVVEHGGFITIDSTENEGTTIDVYLPKSNQTRQQRAPDDAQEAVEGGNETVLVVEDEEQVRDLATLVLSQAGYEVLTAADGQLGWDLFVKERARIKIIVCDVVMPNMGGRQLLAKVREVDASLPFVFISGYVGGPDPRNFAERYDVEFLQKPFSASALQQTVRDALDGRDERRERQRLVLAVDDNEALLHLLELDVKQLGHKILTAASGEAAIRMCERHEFDVIFMDIEMHPMNGIETTRIIRQRSDSAPRIYGLTAHFTADEREKCVAAGMDDMILKPISDQTLVSILGGKYLGQNRSIASAGPSVPLFDQELSLNLANNRAEVAEAMLRILISKLPEHRKSIGQAFDEHNFEELKARVDKLVGAVRYCGVPALSESIKRLEITVSGNNVEDTRDCIRMLNERIEELLAWQRSNPDPFQPGRTSQR